MKSLLNILMLTTVITFSASKSHAGLFMDIEGGIVSSGYNDVRIPGDVGTDISLTDDLKSESPGFFRLRLGINLSERSRLSLLIAPLRIKGSGVVDRNIDYNGISFQSGEYLSSLYRFDSYRLSYSYRLVQSRNLGFDIGITAKIRDAAIKIEGDNNRSEKTNTGFVPLVNFSMDWSITHKFGLLISGDALAAPQGRAEDILIAFYNNISEKVRLRLGYRILEGGADNDEVYNFALAHYLSTGLSITF